MNDNLIRNIICITYNNMPIHVWRVRYDNTLSGRTPLMAYGRELLYIIDSLVSNQWVTTLWLQPRVGYLPDSTPPVGRDRWQWVARSPAVYAGGPTLFCHCWATDGKYCWANDVLPLVGHWWQTAVGQTSFCRPFANLDSHIGRLLIKLKLKNLIFTFQKGHLFCLSRI